MNKAIVQKINRRDADEQKLYNIVWGFNRLYGFVPGAVWIFKCSKAED